MITITVVISRKQYEAFVKWASIRSGLPYSYGGVFSEDLSESTDCSQLVLCSAAFFMNMSPYVRYGSTESFRLRAPIVYELGFLPGPGSSEHFFKVGLLHGGGGPNSHTACTINGVNWESSGSYGVRYGPPARAWNDPMFKSFWHFDGVLEPETTPFLADLSGKERKTVLSGFGSLAVPAA